MAAVIVRNHVKQTNSEHSPYEMSDKLIDTDTSHFRTLGCVAMVKIPKESRHKWHPKARIGMLVGYQSRSPLYRVWIPEDSRKPHPMHGKVIVRADIVCLENTGYWDYAKHANDIVVHSTDDDDMQDALQLYTMHNHGLSDAPEGNQSTICDERDDRQHTSTSIPTVTTPSQQSQSTVNQMTRSGNVRRLVNALTDLNLPSPD